MCTTLPRDFDQYTRTLMGDSLYDTLTAALARDAPVSIRINPYKGAAGRPAGAGLTPVPWCNGGFYLARRPNFTFDPLFHAGLYYVQEASSMFIDHILRQLVTRPVLMLDLCAAPGGKTTAARAALPTGSLLISNEPVKPRAAVLTENVQKFGHPDSIVTNNLPKDFQKSGLCFDVILADVPCSGEGMFRKDKAAIGEWSVQNVETCRRLQRSIVEDVWPCLAPGGLLIYSTCTFNARENEENADYIARSLGADVIALDTPAAWGITGALAGPHPACRFIPGKTKGEGLFVAVLRKHGSGQAEPTEPTAGGQQHNGRRRGNDRQVAACQAWVDGRFSIVRSRDRILAIPTAWQQLYDRAQRTLRVLHAGVTLGTDKGHGITPDASLALSACLAPEAFPRAEVDYATAVSYLRREAIVLPADTPRGPVVVTHRGHALGFVKNIGSRANNLYPGEWKIKSTHLPEQPESVLPEACRPPHQPRCNPSDQPNPTHQ